MIDLLQMEDQLMCLANSQRHYEGEKKEQHLVFSCVCYSSQANREKSSLVINQQARRKRATEREKERFYPEIIHLFHFFLHMATMWMILVIIVAEQTHAALINQTVPVGVHLDGFTLEQVR